MAVCASFIQDPLLPKGVLAAATVTSNQTGITTIVDLTSLSVQFVAIAGRRYRLYAEVSVRSSTATDVMTLTVATSGNVAVQTRSVVCAAVSTDVEIAATAIVTPAAGVTTYKCRLTRSGSGSAQLSASATSPAYLLVEDIGPA